jgi:hypothetical protein
MEDFVQIYWQYAATLLGTIHPRCSDSPAVRGVDANGSVSAAHRVDQSQSIGDTIVQ